MADPQVVIRSITKENRLEIQYVGRIDVAILKRAAPDLDRELAKLAPGFALITDLSGLDHMDVDCVPMITAFMDRCSERKIQTVVRVIPDPAKDIGFNIMSRFHYPSGVAIVTCETRDEAHRVLAP